jgi:hypothetical protein
LTSPEPGFQQALVEGAVWGGLDDMNQKLKPIALSVILYLDGFLGEAMEVSHEKSK